MAGTKLQETQNTKPHEKRLTSCLLSLAPYVLLLLMFAQMAVESRLTSLTVDEPLHIISGYSFLKTGDARLVEEHPLLVKSIAAWPLLLMPDLGDPRTVRGWNEASLVTVMRALLLPYPALDRVAFASRAPIMWLGMLLAALVYRWASDWLTGGPQAGLVALGLCALDPNIVAHAQLATTDIGVTLFLCAAFYALWRWSKLPTFTQTVTVGVSLGLALASKMSALIALPVIAGIVCFTYARPQPNGWRGAINQFGQALKSITIMFGIALVVIWATYGFELRWLPGWPIPVPAGSHLIPLARLFEHQRAGHSTFLWGRNSQMGWWYYFPLAFALKTPLPTLILLLATFWGWLGPALRQPQHFRKLGQIGLLLAFPIVYFVTALSSSVDIGYRHLLPILPMLFVFAASSWAWLERQKCSKLKIVGQGAFGALALWHVCSVATAAPWPLSYFNELAGGPANGYQFLVDSNLDWGQSFKELAAYLDQRETEPVKLSAMMFLEPAGYGVKYEPLPPARKAPPQFAARFNPAPGTYVISASSLQGVATPDINTYAFFRTLTPTARLGNALFIYNLPQAQSGEWVAQCTPPPALLEQADIAAGFGRDDLRRVYFDCATSWWYPATRAPGWHIQNPQAPGLNWYSGAQTVFRARTADGQPYFDIVHIAQPTLPFSLTTVAYIAPDKQVSAPVTTTGPLTFAGFWSASNCTPAQPGGTITLFTVWTVAHVPDSPLSIMLHLTAAGGRVAAVKDGLGVPIDMWQAGDMLVQAHQLEIPADLADGVYWAETGIYKLDTQEHYSMTAGNQTTNQLKLAPVEISQSVGGCQ
jgi:hypothetical protein